MQSNNLRGGLGHPGLQTLKLLRVLLHTFILIKLADLPDTARLKHIPRHSKTFCVAYSGNEASLGLEPSAQLDKPCDEQLWPVIARFPAPISPIGHTQTNRALFCDRPVHAHRLLLERPWKLHQLNAEPKWTRPSQQTILQSLETPEFPLVVSKSAHSQWDVS